MQRPNLKLQKTRWLKPAIILAVAVLALTFFVYIYISHYTHSNAKDVAQPIESELLARGATKVCGGGSAGHGPDDYVSGYTAYYETSLSREEAIELIKNASASNGFNIKQAQPGMLPVSDKYIGGYYFDHSSKMTSFSGAESGPAKLTFAVGNTFSEDINTSYEVFYPPCNKESLNVNNDAQHTSIKMQLELTRNKW